MVVDPHGKGDRFDVAVHNIGNMLARITHIHGPRSGIQARIERLHGLVEHDFMPVLMNGLRQSLRAFQPRKYGISDRYIQVQKIPGCGHAAADVIDNDGHPGKWESLGFGITRSGCRSGEKIGKRNADHP